MYRKSSKMILNIAPIFIALYSLDLISGQGTTQQCIPVLQNTAQVRLQGRSTEDQCTLLTNSSAIIVAANEALFVPGTTIPSSCIVRDIEVLSCITRTRKPRSKPRKGKGKGGKGKKGKTGKKDKSKSRSNSKRTKSKSRSNSRSRSNSQSTSRNMRTFEITFQATLSCNNANPCVIHVSNVMTTQILQDQQQQLRNLFRGNQNFPRSFEATGMTVDVRSVRIEQESFCGSQAISTRSRTRSRSRSLPVQLCGKKSFT